MQCEANADADADADDCSSQRMENVPYFTIIMVPSFMVLNIHKTTLMYNECVKYFKLVSSISSISNLCQVFQTFFSMLMQSELH